MLIVIVASFVYSASATIKLPRFPLTVIHEFPSPSWIENIAIRENGDLLVTSLSSPLSFLWTGLVDSHLFLWQRYHKPQESQVSPSLKTMYFMSPLAI